MSSIDKILLTTVLDSKPKTAANEFLNQLLNVRDGIDTAHLYSEWAEKYETVITKQAIVVSDLIDRRITRL